MSEHYQQQLGVKVGVFVIVTHMGSNFGCKKIIKGLIKLKFRMWNISSQVGIINNIWVWQWV